MSRNCNIFVNMRPESNGNVSFVGLQRIGICGSHAYREEQPWVPQGPIREALGGRKHPDGNVRHPGPGRLRDPSPQDRDGFDLISDRLRRGPIWYAEPDAVRSAVAYAKYRSRSRSHRAIIRVFDEGGNVTETHA